LSRCLSLGLALAGLAAPAFADAILDVSGGVVATTPRLAVRVTLTNRGDRAAGPIDVEGELFDETERARLAAELAPGASADVALEFDAVPRQPGLHALALRIEHPAPGPRDAADNPPLASRRAFLLLALGARPTPAVRLRAEPLALDVRGALVVHLAASDEAARVTLRALTARGIRAESGPVEVAVPARGEATARVALVRASAPRGSRQEVLLVAETKDAPLARTAVELAVVRVADFPSRLARLRTPLYVVGVALLAVALGYELRLRLGGRSSEPA
jgi:hypothetical protein